MLSKNFYRSLTAVIIICSGVHKDAFAQDIEEVSSKVKNITKEDPVVITGGINMSSNFSKYYNKENLRPPLFGVFNANLNLRFFNTVSAPFSFQYSPQSKDFRYPGVQLQPFNQMGMSPSYRGITLHLGYRSVPISSFTSSGANFHGAGCEVAIPGSRYKLSGFYGRLNKGIRVAEEAIDDGIALYDRMGIGAKVSAETGKQGNTIELAVFQAWDKTDTLLFPELIAFTPPKENLIVSIIANQRIGKFSFQTEYAVSTFTEDTGSRDIPENYGMSKALKFVGYKTNASTHWDNAINAAANYSGGTYNLGVIYRRIDPDYQSMGIPFLNNDMENLTVNLSTALLQRKVNLSASAGAERNNLDGVKVARTKRFINSLNVSYAINQSWHITGSVSNFNTSTEKMLIENFDSLRYFQLTENFNTAVSHKFGNEQTTHSLNLSGGGQRAKDAQGNHSEVLNGLVNYALTVQAIGASGSIGVNANINSFIGTQNKGIGPAITTSKSFGEKLKTTISYNLLNYYNDGSLNSTTENISASLSWTPAQAHAFSLNTSWMKLKGIAIESYGEWRGAIQYSYNFQKKTKRSNRNE